MGGGGVGPRHGIPDAALPPLKKNSPHPAPPPYSLGGAGGCGGVRRGSLPPNPELFSPFSPLRFAKNGDFVVPNPSPPSYGPGFALMRVLGWLRRHDQNAGDHPSRAEFDALLKRVEALDEVQLSRELAWKEIRDQISRYLSRAAALEQRARQRESNGGDEASDHLVAVLRAKYPKLGS